MLKKMYSRKILATTAVLFALLLVYLVPKENTYSLQDIPQKVSYVDKNIKTSTIYLWDSNHLLARTEVPTNNTEVTSLAKELLQILIKDGEGNDKIPSGFQAVLPSETKILSIGFENDILKVDLSKELLDVTETEEESLISSIVYTLTSIEGIENIILYVDGDILSKLPQSKINLPSTLNRKIGINKEYDLKSFNDITSVTVYYIGSYNDDYYYVPVTKYLNSDREKIKIIIDELASGPTYGSNLMSFLNGNTKLLATEQEVDTLFLTFNEYIFSDMDERNILEEVLYTIELSIAENYDVKEVIFEVDNQEIYKSVLKSIE